MVSDLPDYEKKIIIVTPPGEYPAIVQVDLRKILGVDFITPTIAGCVPTSIENEAIAYDATNDWFKQYIENPAIAYNSVTDRFKVDIEAMTVGALTVIQPDETLLKATVTQAAKDRTVTGTVTAEQSDASKLKATVSATDLDIRNLTTTDRVEVCPDSDTALLGDGADNSPRIPVDASLRYVHSVVYPRMFNGATWDRIRGTVAGGLLVNISNADLDIRPLVNTDVVSVEQSDETKLKATVTQAAKDRTISDITKTTTITSVTASSSGNNIIQTPTAGKKIRVKLVDVWNNGTAAITVYLRFAAAGTARFKKTLAANTGFIINLIGTNWEGAADEVLYINLSAAGTVDVTVMKDEV